jgi:hypothetical protein
VVAGSAIVVAGPAASAAAEADGDHCLGKLLEMHFCCPFRSDRALNPDGADALTSSRLGHCAARGRHNIVVAQRHLARAQQIGAGGHDLADRVKIHLQLPTDRAVAQLTLVTQKQDIGDRVGGYVRTTPRSAIRPAICTHLPRSVAMIGSC